MKPPVTLLTDFGDAGPYVGSVKGVLLSRTRAPVVDLTHAVPRHDVLFAAFYLASAAPYFPEGTVHCAVVDPGVGTERRGIAVRAGGQFLVGPDNGLLVPVAEELGEVEVREIGLELGPVSPTFHGRDVFAPTAARLSEGLDFREVGREVEPETAELFVHEETDGWIRTRVAFVDRFGNVVTGIPAEALEGEWFEVEATGSRFEVRRVETYGEAEEGELALLEGSTGLTELAVNRGSGARATGAEPGEEILIRPRGDSISR